MPFPLRVFGLEFLIYTGESVTSADDLFMPESIGSKIMLSPSVTVERTGNPISPPHAATAVTSRRLKT